MAKFSKQQPDTASLVMTPLEAMIVRKATEIDSLAELCNYIEYEADKGRVPGYFKPKYEVLRLVQSIFGTKG